MAASFQSPIAAIDLFRASSEPPSFSCLVVHGPFPMLGFKASVRSVRFPSVLRGNEPGDAICAGDLLEGCKNELERCNALLSINKKALRHRAERLVLRLRINDGTEVMRELRPLL